MFANVREQWGVPTGSRPCPVSSTDPRFLRVSAASQRSASPAPRANSAVAMWHAGCTWAAQRKVQSSMRHFALIQSFVLGLGFFANGCFVNPSSDSEDTAASASELQSENGLYSSNGLTTANGLGTSNGLLAANGLSTNNGLRSSNGIRRRATSTSASSR